MKRQLEDEGVRSLKDYKANNCSLEDLPYPSESIDVNMPISDNHWGLKRRTSSIWKAERDGGQNSEEMTVGSCRL